MKKNRLKLKKFIGLLVVAIIAVLTLAPPSHAGGTHVSVGVGIGVGYPGWGYPGWGWGYRGWWGPGPWGYRPYWGTGVYYAGPPIVVAPPVTYAPPAVVQQAPAAASPAPQPEQYWYYCQESQAYYPYVKQCPQGWMKVVPQAQPPAR